MAAESNRARTSLKRSSPLTGIVRRPYDSRLANAVGRSHRMSQSLAQNQKTFFYEAAGRPESNLRELAAVTRLLADRQETVESAVECPKTVLGSYPAGTTPSAGVKLTPAGTSPQYKNAAQVGWHKAGKRLAQGRAAFPATANPWGVIAHGVISSLTRDCLVVYRIGCTDGLARRYSLYSLDFEGVPFFFLNILFSTMPWSVPLALLQPSDSWVLRLYSNRPRY